VLGGRFVFKPVVGHARLVVCRTTIRVFGGISMR